MNLEYNNERTPLIIPEYGRHIQKMVTEAVSISNREERNKVAKAIITFMGNLNPHLRDVPDFQHKLWDQLFIISDFELDVDSPYPKPSREMLQERPQRLNYPQNFPKYRFYGNNIKKMIDVCTQWEKGDLKEALEYAIANHMKKCYLSWNKETVSDSIIFQHLYELSDGKINLAAQAEELTDTDELMKVHAKHKNGIVKKYHHGAKNKKRY